MKDKDVGQGLTGSSGGLGRKFDLSFSGGTWGEGQYV